MARAFPYRARPPPEVATILSEIPYSRLFVIHESGPTSFVLRTEESARKLVALQEPEMGNELSYDVVLQESSMQEQGSRNRMGLRRPSPLHIVQDGEGKPTRRQICARPRASLFL